MSRYEYKRVTVLMRSTNLLAMYPHRDVVQRQYNQLGR